MSVSLEFAVSGTEIVDELGMLCCELFNRW